MIENTYSDPFGEAEPEMDLDKLATRIVVEVVSRKIVETQTELDRVGDELAILGARADGLRMDLEHLQDAYIYGARKLVEAA